MRRSKPQNTPKAYLFVYNHDKKYKSFVIVETSKQNACKQFVKWLDKQALNGAMVVLIRNLRRSKKNAEFLTHAYIAEQNKNIEAGTL